MLNTVDIVIWRKSSCVDCLPESSFLLDKVLNMDIFLTQTLASLQKAFINPPEPFGALLSLMDALWWTSKKHTHSLPL